MNINERIFYELDKQGFKQVSLAKFLNIRTGTISNWRKKKIIPSDKYISKIAEFLNVSEEYLRTGKDDKNVVSGTISNSAIVQGNHASTLIVRNGEVHERELSEMESLLLKVFNELETGEKAELLSYAFKLKKK